MSQRQRGWLTILCTCPSFLFVPRCSICNCRCWCTSRLSAPRTSSIVADSSTRAACDVSCLSPVTLRCLRPQPGPATAAKLPLRRRVSSYETAGRGRFPSSCVLSSATCIYHCQSRMHSIASNACHRYLRDRRIRSRNRRTTSTRLGDVSLHELTELCHITDFACANRLAPVSNPPNFLPAMGANAPAITILFGAAQHLRFHLLQHGSVLNTFLLFAIPL